MLVIGPSPVLEKICLLMLSQGSHHLFSISTVSTQVVTVDSALTFVQHVAKVEVSVFKLSNIAQLHLC